MDTHLCQPPRHDDTVPRTYEAEDLLDEALKENLSPEAAATLANAVRVHLNGRRTNREVRDQLEWLADRIVQLVGGKQAYHDLLKEVGL